MTRSGVKNMIEDYWRKLYSVWIGKEFDDDDMIDRGSMANIYAWKLMYAYL